MTDDLVAFLRQRLDEDEAVIRRNLDGHGLGDDGIYPDYQTYDGEDIDAAEDFLQRFVPPRMLREVEAQRRIIERYERQHWHAPAIPTATSAVLRQEEIGACRTCVTNKFLALPYADHPDYRDEWRP